MKWIEMTVFTTEQGLDAVAARFDMLGIQQVMIEQGREMHRSFFKGNGEVLGLCGYG